ncbi:MAG: ChbG/HpnK family deacetylase [Rhodothermales bacterium]|nr:ChbG/HpnK family deacetylase [Rhodothermales bacterium]
MLLTLTACVQPPPRLIVRGDDMGYAHAGNEAIMKTYTDGIVTSVEVIVPSPWFPEAVRMLADHPDLDIGVHLAITSEWDNVKWRPMTPAPSLRDADGYFYPMICPNKNYPGYEDVAIDRQGVTDLWTDPRIRQKIEALGIDLIGYDDL